MKKIIIAMIAVVLGLSSCSKESMLLGSWKLETIQMGNMTLDTGDTESDAVITFKDGEILEFTSAGLTESCPYTINDNKIIVNDEEFEFEVNSKTLVLKGNLNISDIEGPKVAVVLTFKKL
jgi:hypothetical protein